MEVDSPKTTNFCETSSIFEKLTTSKTKQFWATSFENGQLSAELMASYQRVLLAPATKKWGQIIQSASLAKVLRNWGALYVLTSECGSRHHGVQFFLSHLRTRRFSEPTFDPPEPQNIGKKRRCLAAFLPLHELAFCFFWLFLFSDLLFSSFLFWISHVCFTICPHCRKFDF